MIRATNDHDAQIKALLLDNWDMVSDDGSTEDFSIDYDTMIILYNPGFMSMFVPMNHTMADAHICSNLKGSELLAHESFDYLVKRTSIRNLIASIPVYNKKCIAFAERIGFERAGINKSSFLKNGKLTDTILYTRRLLCHQQPPQ